MRVLSTNPARILVRVLAVLAAAMAMVTPAGAGTRLKDILDVEGVRDNQLLGYGVVTGLNGTGDSLRNCAFTKQSLESMMERLGINTRNSTLNTANAAAVMVTANLPPFATSGSRIDITVSALCDSDSLEGGVLLATPLSAANGQVYALAQGSVAIGGFTASGNSGTALTRNIPTTGRIPNGATIERENRYDLAGQSELRLSLRNPDFTTATRVATAINAFVGSNAAAATDPATVRLRRPPGSRDMASLLSEIELIEIEPDQPARIIINEVTGVIVMGENVRVSQVAIAQGNLTIHVQEDPGVAMPNSFTSAKPVVVPQSNISVTEDNADLAVMGGNGVPLRELVTGLNALGVSPRDLISILQALKASGALQAEIEIM
ncbi:MAG TPA: flagellar basal body P-ring protein FlgI [Hyphomonadaceae bacterium]|nr:flagellar basal body P-ring protein FlgI [Hyphomonadaceae bacterium]